MHKAVGMWREHVAVVTGNQFARPPYVIWLLRRWMADMAEVGAENACDSRGVGCVYISAGLIIKKIGFRFFPYREKEDWSLRARHRRKTSEAPFVATDPRETPTTRRV